MMSKSQFLNEAIGTSEKEIAQYMVDNTDTYKDLLTKLICQSLIKLMEAEVMVRCRESDKDLVESILDDSGKMYQKIMSENVQFLKGREPPIKLTIDEKNWLPEYNPDDKTNSCVGGVKLTARKNRIVCSNTLDDRLDLTKQEAIIPRIKELLFPNI